MGQYLTAQAKESIETHLPKDKAYYAAFNYGEIVEIREESDRLRIEWQIPDFLSLRRETSDAFISPVFNFLDSRCYLMYSPFVDDDVEGWSDVYIYSKTLETSVTYTLSIKKVDGTVEDINTFTGTALEGWFPPLEEKFLKMGDLLERQFTLISSGVLTVIFTIRKAEASDLEGWLYFSENTPSTWIHVPGENFSEIECVPDNKTEKGENFSETESVRDNRTEKGENFSETESVRDNRTEKGESLPEIECVPDNKTAQDKEPEVICLTSNDDVEKDPQPSGEVPEVICLTSNDDVEKIPKPSGEVPEVICLTSNDDVENISKPSGEVPEVICLTSNDDVENISKPSVQSGIQTTMNNNASSGIRIKKLKYRRAQKAPKTNTEVQPYPFSGELGAVFKRSSTSTFVSKGTQTSISAIYKECDECDSLQTKGISTLTRHLEDLLLRSEDHDVNIDVQNRRFKAHKFILMSRSPVFASMFQHDMEEKASGNISIEDCDPDAFGEFLKHVYTGKAKIDSYKSAIALYYAGDKYDFQELKEMCVNYLKESTFETTTICDIIKMTTVHGETDLLETAISFFSENLDEILQTDEWQRFLLSNVSMANDMLKRAVKNLSKKH